MVVSLRGYVIERGSHGIKYELYSTPIMAKLSPIMELPLIVLWIIMPCVNEKWTLYLSYMARLKL